MIKTYFTTETIQVRAANLDVSESAVFMAYSEPFVSNVRGEVFRVGDRS